MILVISSDVSCSQLLSITVSTFHPDFILIFHPDFILISLHLHPLELFKIIHMIPPVRICGSVAITVPPDARPRHADGRFTVLRRCSESFGVSEANNSK